MWSLNPSQDQITGSSLLICNFLCNIHAIHVFIAVWFSESPLTFTISCILFAVSSVTSLLFRYDIHCFLSAIHGFLCAICDLLCTVYGFFWTIHGALNTKILYVTLGINVYAKLEAGNVRFPPSALFSMKHPMKSSLLKFWCLFLRIWRPLQPIQAKEN